MTDKREYSDKSYVTAAVLAGIFGMIGIHHFYVGRWGHGLFDLSMTVLVVRFRRWQVNGPSTTPIPKNDWVR